ncbi:MAG: hypothetical protein WCA29_01105 [Jiangellales bacterium]
MTTTLLSTDVSFFGPDASGPANRLPDSLGLTERARQAGVPVDLHVGDDLPQESP